MAKASGVVVGCVKWGDRYGPDYVNVLYRATRDNLSLPHRFVCVTDEAEGLDPGIEVAPFPEFDPPRETWRTSCFPKIAMLAPGVVADDELVLQIDLDLMIVGPLDDFFALLRRKPAFYSLREWNPALVRALVPLSLRPVRGTQGSVYLYLAGDQRQMYEHFTSHIQQVFDTWKSDRFYFPQIARDPAYLPVDWCPSFKNSCLWYWPLSLVTGEPKLPAQARILIFHGVPRPLDLTGPPGKRWGTPRKFGHQPVSWVKEYWTRYGGRLQSETTA